MRSGNWIVCLAPIRGSSLIGQTDRDNIESEAADAKCFQCGHEYDQRQLAEMVVSASYEIDAYYAAKNGDSSPIATCPRMQRRRLCREWRNEHLLCM